MGRFAPKHPAELQELVGTAQANGQSAVETCRQLKTGRLAGWPQPYDMPLETVRYYGKRARQARRRKTVSPEVAENAKTEVDRLARLLLTAATRGVEEVIGKHDQDPKPLKDWGETLKVLQALVTDQAVDPSDKRGKRKRQPAPTDPLSARLLSSSTEKDKTTENGTSATPTANGTHTDKPNGQPTPNGDNHGGVPARATDSWPWRGEGEAA